MARDQNLLVIFARAPRAGSVKTRLLGVFSPEEAVAIHQALLGDVLERSLAALGSSGTVRLAWSEPPGEELPVPAPIEDRLQSAGDLGERMATAVQEGLAEGFARVVILGSDSPTLPGDRLGAAFSLLADHDVVIGPAEDGGYYLIGMSRLHPAIFRNIAWGSEKVLAVTRARLKKARVSFAELGTWHDVDTPEDVGRLWKELVRMKASRPDEVPGRSWSLLSALVPGRII
jgi:hypothetical protein